MARNVFYDQNLAIAIALLIRDTCLLCSLFKVCYSIIAMAWSIKVGQHAEPDVQGQHRTRDLRSPVGPAECRGNPPQWTPNLRSIVIMKLEVKAEIRK